MATIDLNDPNQTSSMVAAISEQVGDELTPAQIQKVLTAWNATQAGDPPGTIRRDEATGMVAHRVEEEGILIWRVTHPNGAQHNDLSPTLDWPEIG